MYFLPLGVFASFVYFDYFFLQTPREESKFHIFQKSKIRFCVAKMYFYFGHILSLYVILSKSFMPSSNYNTNANHKQQLSLLLLRYSIHSKFSSVSSHSKFSSTITLFCPILLDFLS